MRVLLALMRARGSTTGVAASLLLVCAALTCSHYEARLGRRTRAALDALLWAALLGVGGLAVLDAAANVHWPRAWDFPSFYAVARALARGRAFYDPAVLTAMQAEIARGAPVPSDWLKEVGYWYLPPSAFLLWPLGFLGFRAALIVHYSIQAAFLAGSAWLLHRMFPLGRGATGLAMVLLLMLLFRPVQETVFYAQIVFGSLFFLVLAMRLLDRSGVACGVSLALGFLHKHLLLIPAGLMLVDRDRRSRNAGLATLATLGTALAGSALVFGPGVFGAYLANGPGARSPELAVDPVVQSLMALLYRALHGQPRGSLLAIVAYPPFLIAAGALTLATLVFLWRSPQSARHERLALVASLALLCYPNTLISTLALLFPLALGIHWTALRRGWPFPLALLFIVVVYGVVGFLPRQAGWMSLLTWCGAAILLLTSPPDRTPRTPVGELAGVVRDARPA